MSGPQDEEDRPSEAKAVRYVALAGKTLLYLVPFLAIAPCLSPVALVPWFTHMVMLWVFLVLGYSLTVLGDLMAHRPFDWPRFFIALALGIGLAIAGPVYAAAAMPSR